MPRPRVLLAPLLAWSALAMTQAEHGSPTMPWWQRAGEGAAGAYRIKTDLPADRARRIALHLNVMHQEYSRRLASLPARLPAPMNVMAFEREFDYLDTLEYRFGIDATGTGGMFFANRTGSALAFFTSGLPRRRLEHVIQHEGFHQFAYSRFGGDLPLWVNEGLAEFFGEAVVVGREVIIGQSNARVVQRVRDAVEDGGYVPFRRMLSLTSERWNDALRDGEASGLYHQAWSMVHFLVYGDDARYVEPFERYLRLLNTGVRSERAFADVFGSDLEAFEQRWKEYARTMRPSSFATALDRIDFLAAGALELSRRKIVPPTLEALREDLVRIGYVQTRSGPEFDVRLTAIDAMFRIPWYGHELEQRPVFEVTKPRTPVTRREQHLEASVPTPAGLRTRFLDPYDLVVEWTRDPVMNRFSYEIRVERR